MSFVVFSDLHLHNWTYGAKLNGPFNSRLINQQKVLFQMIDYCKLNNIKEAVFCGDFFHTHGKVATEVLDVAYSTLSAFKHYGIKMTFLVGNHDMADKAGSIHSLGFLNEYGEVIGRYDTNSAVRSVDGRTAHFLAYTEDKERLKEFLGGVTKDSYVFMHQGVANVPMGSGYVINEILTPDMVPDHICHAFTGHYHNYKTVTPKLTIVGTPLQLNWNDEGAVRGWLHVKDDNVAHVSSNAPKFMSLDMGGSSVADIGKDAGIAVGNNFIRVKNYQGDTTALRELLLILGAETVEFVLAQKTIDRTAGPNKRDGFSLNDALVHFEKQAKLSERYVTVGAKLREGRYETPII